MWRQVRSIYYQKNVVGTNKYDIFQRWVLIDVSFEFEGFTELGMLVEEYCSNYHMNYVFSTIPSNDNPVSINIWFYN